MPSGWPIAIAPPLTFTRSRVEAELADHGEALRRERLVQLDEVEVGRSPIPSRSSSLRTAGTGPMPITRGSTPATALADEAPSGSAPSSRARSSLAITSAAAPSLIPLELPAVTVPPARKAGFSDAELLGASCPGADARRARGRRRRRARRRRSARAAQRCCDSSANASWSSRETLPALGDVLARLAHRLEREHRLAAAGSGTASRASCRRRSGRRAGRPGRASPCTSGARLIDSTPPATKRSPSPAATAWHGRDDRGEAGGAEPVDASRPATDSGSPASSAAMRATLRLSSPAWFAQPR